MAKFLKLYSDGFTLGANPSPRGGGYTICADDGSLVKTETFQKQWFTNNEGEVRGIIEALKFLEDGGEVITDSFCAMRWVTNGRAKPRHDLSELLREGQKLLSGKKITLEPRETNLAGQYNEFNLEKRYTI